MTKLMVSPQKDHFISDGKATFYLADTVWNAFYNTSIEDWKYYLDYRKAQGFNALQISILPIVRHMPHAEGVLLPFAVRENGSWDYGQLNEKYFDRARELLRYASDRGFIPSLVVLWANYIPDSWATQFTPNLIMPEEVVSNYVRQIIKYFDEFHPIYMMSGDTDFPSENTIKFLQTALGYVKHHAPDALVTFHMQPHIDLVDEFIHDPAVDFYMYQSGHAHEEQTLPYTLAEHFLNKEITRPILNGEPCYEGIGYFKKQGRFTAIDVRKALWQSLLSGAKAGFTYGAHGMWSWHKSGQDFTDQDVWGMPFDIRDAVRLKGAWDVSYAKWLYETFNWFDMIPSKEIISNDTEEIRASVTHDHEQIIVYAPFSIEIKLKWDLSTYDITAIDLESRSIVKPSISIEAEISTIEMLGLNGDVLYICHNAI